MTSIMIMHAIQKRIKMSLKFVEIFNSFNQKLAKISCFSHVLMRVCKYIPYMQLFIITCTLHIVTQKCSTIRSLAIIIITQQNTYFALVHQCQRLPRISGHQVQSTAELLIHFSNTVSNFVFISIHHALLFSLICITRYVL